MSLQFDHMVLLVHDLEQAVSDFEALGFTVLERADTSHGATVFRFVSFADGSYILLTAFTADEARKGHRLGPVLDSGEGWADYSFVVPSASDSGDALKADGRPVAGPVEVSNVLADGARWSLDLLMTGRGAKGDAALPFLVSDNEGRRHRIPGPSTHANGANGIRGVRVASTKPQAVADTLVAMGGTHVGPGGGGDDGLRVAFGDMWVDVLDAGQLSDARPEGGMIALTVTAEGLPAEGRALDTTLSHGAAISLVPA